MAEAERYLKVSPEGESDGTVINGLGVARIGVKRLTAVLEPRKMNIRETCEVFGWATLPHVCRISWAGHAIDP